MSDARPLPSQTTTGTGGVSRRYSKTMEITLGPPSTMSATTGTPWPIPALKKEKKRKKKKRGKNTKPANQRNKKRNKKQKLKLLSTGEIRTYEGIKHGAKMLRRLLWHQGSPFGFALSLGRWGQWRHRLSYFYWRGGCIGQGGRERNRLVDETLSQQPKDGKWNVILSKSHVYLVL